MARIDGDIVIGRPVEAVFDYVADQSNEPQYNPQMVRAEKITAGPVGAGTRFRSAVASMGRTAGMLIECTGYDRPRRLDSVTTMRQADISYTLTFEPAAAGTRMHWSGQVRPKGALRLLGPAITRLGTRQEQRIWASLKRHMETRRNGYGEGGTGRPVKAPVQVFGPGPGAGNGNRADMTRSEQGGPANRSSPHGGTMRLTWWNAARRCAIRSSRRGEVGLDRRWP